jgi:HK97 family phage major capsid protein
MQVLAQIVADLEQTRASITDLLDAEATRTLSAEETEKFNALEIQAAELEAKADRRRKHLANVKKQIADSAADGGLDIGDASTIETHDRRADDPQMGFEGLGEFAQCVFNASNPAGSRDERLDFVVNFGNATGLSQGVGPEGGFMVPPAFSQAIYDEMQAQSDNLLQYCDVYPVVGDSLTFPAVDESSRAAGSRWGGVRGYWLAEGAQMTASKPKLRQVKLEPHGLAVLVYATDKLLQNAPAMQQFITRAAADEINFNVGDAIVNGTGVGKPKGILAGGGPTVSVAKETNQAADTILHMNIAKMWSRMHPRARGNAIWLYNVDCEPQLDTLYTEIKNVAGAENVGGIASKVFEDGKIKGRQAIPCEYCATVGDAGDILAVSMKGYAVGIKSGAAGGLKTAMSIHLKFDYNETAFRFIYEVDGQPWLASAITPAKGSNTLSTFVKLAARA